MSDRQTLPDTPSAISSPASAAGPSLFDGLDLPTPPASGQAHAHASRSPRQGNAKATPTNGTCGRSSPASSASADLQSSLANKLRERLGSAGSMEYSQTWKEKATPAGRRYLAHTASARRISDSDSFGWPTPASRDWKDTPGMATTATNPDGSARTRLDQLPRVANLAGWPTPQAFDANNCQRSDEAMSRALAGRQFRNGGPPSNLREVAQRACDGMEPTSLSLTGWPTPNANERGPEANESKDARGSGGIDLQSTAMLAGWGTPRATDGTNGGPNQGDPSCLPKHAAQAGPPSTFSLAATAKRGVLNANLSRWLMGFPLSWTLCGMLAYQKTKSRRRSKPGR